MNPAPVASTSFQAVSRSRELGAWVRRIRLRHWVHFLALPLATVDVRAGRVAAFAAVRGVASAFMILAFGYLLNSVADRDTDLDARKNPLITSDAEYSWSLLAFGSASLLLSVWSPWPVRLATICSLAIGYVYSMGPRIKALPFVGSLANLGNFVPLLFLGMCTSTLPPRFGYLVLTFASLLLQNQFIHEAGDAVEDRSAGTRTTWLTLGPRWTAVLAASVGIVGLVGAASAVPSPRWTPIVAGGTAVFGAAFPLLLAWCARNPRAAVRLRLHHRWCAAFFGAGLFLAWLRT